MSEKELIGSKGHEATNFEIKRLQDRIEQLSALNKEIELAALTAIGNKEKAENDERLARVEINRLNLLIVNVKAVADAARRVDRGHWFAEGGYIPESDWIALMNTLAALDEENSNECIPEVKEGEDCDSGLDSDYDNEGGPF